MANETKEFVKLLSLKGDKEIEDQPASIEVELKPSNNAGCSGQNVMKKEINVFTGVAYVVGGIIGSGIFVTPSTILTLTHSFGLSMVIWILGGIIAILGGLCYVELGLLIRKSGGEYSYIKEAYSFKKKTLKFEVLSSLLAFTYIWSSVLVIRSSTTAIVSLTSARYMICPFYTDCNNLPQEMVVCLALTIIVTIGLVNCYGLKFAARMMSFFTICKILTVIFIVVIGIVVIIQKGSFPKTFQHPFENLNAEPPTVFSVALSFYSVLFAYDGWNAMSYAVEETKNVKRTMPLAIYIGVSIVTICYLLVNISFFAVLRYDQIENAVAVALPFSKEAIGTAGVVIIPILVSISAFGATNGSLFSASRVIFVAAREGHLPKFLSGLHKTAKTPVPAILLQVFTSMVMIVGGSIEQLIQAAEYATYIFVCLSIIAVFIFRVTHAKEPRIFDTWFIVPVASVMVCVSLLLMIIPVIQSPVRPLISLSMMLTAVPVFIIFVLEKPYKIRPKFVDKLNEYITQCVGLYLNSQPTR